jgi:2-amino-4-hydroxy-6-hydroxymethyldihydropteridine diphosphokinase
MSSGSMTDTADAEAGPHTAWLGLGTNLGDRGDNLARALAGIGEVSQITAVSSIYETDPVGYADQPVFWNMVVRCRTRLDPLRLLRAVKSLETRLGRTPTFRMGPRLIDIDVLMVDDVTLDSPDLALPHHGLTDRAFVLLPLLEVDPAARHPVTGDALADAVAGLATSGVRVVATTADLPAVEGGAT